MNGIIIADKPERWTSHDVVSAVKRKLGAAKVGHLGTLDPFATGVLPLVINGATKSARFLDGGIKQYEAFLKLGEETDTYDRDGKVIAMADAFSITEEGLKAAFKGFLGKIKQIPPMYSSIKRGGVPLYKLARKGIIVEREPKEVEIFSIEVTSFVPPYAGFSVACSRGTYIRSICNDLGRSLGCGAHLVSLRRTGCGSFLIGEAVSPEATSEFLYNSIIPVDEALRRVSPPGAKGDA